MSDKITPSSGAERPGLGLTRRSLVAAAGILAAVGPGAAKSALASGNRGPGGPNGPGRPGWYSPPRWNPWPPKPHHNGNHKCLLAGTRIMTPTCEVPIEQLKLGDLVVTKDGTPRGIRWISRTIFERDVGALWAEDVRPIRIAKDAIGPGCPHSDLYLSPAHMLYLNGVLIPAGDLVNGRTIVAVSPDAVRLEYFHVELDRHDVLIAEGAPCESLLATAARRSDSANADEYSALYGSLSAADMVPCAPIASYNGGRGALKSRLRSALALVVDLRRPADIVRDDVEARALYSKAA